MTGRDTNKQMRESERLREENARLRASLAAILEEAKKANDVG